MLGIGRYEHPTPTPAKKENKSFLWQHDPSKPEESAGMKELLVKNIPNKAGLT